MGIFEKIFEIGSWCVNSMSLCESQGISAGGMDFASGDIGILGPGRKGASLDPIEFFVYTLSASPNSRTQFAEKLLQRASETPGSMRMALSPALPSVPGGASSSCSSVHAGDDVTTDIIGVGADPNAPGYEHLSMPPLGLDDLDGLGLVDTTTVGAIGDFALSSVEVPEAIPTTSIVPDPDFAMSGLSNPWRLNLSGNNSTMNYATSGTLGSAANMQEMVVSANLRVQAESVPRFTDLGDGILVHDFAPGIGSMQDEGGGSLEKTANQSGNKNGSHGFSSPSGDDDKPEDALPEGYSGWLGWGMVE
jgi:hypothetical protein